MNKTDLDSLLEVEVVDLAHPWSRGMPVSPTRPPFQLTLIDTGCLSDHREQGYSCLPALPWNAYPRLKAQVKVNEASIHRDVA